MTNICTEYGCNAHDRFVKGNCQAASYASTMYCVVIYDTIHINCSCENKDLSVLNIYIYNILFGTCFHIRTSTMCTNQPM